MILWAIRRALSTVSAASFFMVEPFAPQGLDDSVPLVGLCGRVQTTIQSTVTNGTINPYFTAKKVAKNAENA